MAHAIHRGFAREDILTVAPIQRGIGTSRPEVKELPLQELSGEEVRPL
jgi:hypothetical protein